MKVVVVESHQQVLVHIHEALRRRLCHWTNGNDSGMIKTKKENEKETSSLSSFSWTLVHFDAHADLACPSKSLPALLCWRPYQELGPTPPPPPSPGAGDDDDAANNTTTTTTTGCSNHNKNTIMNMNLYDHLEGTTSGIAEWIIPLVVAAECRRVIWIRPSAETQQQTQCASLETGTTHTITAGAWIPTTTLPLIQNQNQQRQTIESSFLDLPMEACIKVDSQHPYYVDDDDNDDDDDYCCYCSDCCDGCQYDACTGATTMADHVSKKHGCIASKKSPKSSSSSSYAPVSEMICPATFHVHVMSVDDDDDDDDTIPILPMQPSSGDCDGDWVLDICLDYFYCSNPFWFDLHKADAILAEALTWLVQESVLYNNNNTNHSPDRPSHDRRRRSVGRFRKLLRQLISMSTRTTPSTDYSDATTTTAAAAAAAAATAATATAAANIIQTLLLKEYYYPPTVSAVASSYLTSVRNRIESLEAPFPSSSSSSFEQYPHPQPVVQLAMESIPYLTLPMDTGLDELSKHEENDWPLRIIHHRLHAFKQCLLTMRLPWQIPIRSRPSVRRRPLLITIARSAHDGYLPTRLVEPLQHKVIQIVKDVYENNQSNEAEAAPIEIILDYYD